jgi:argininosuccinate lyase
MNEKFPAQSYKDNVLADCFEDAKKHFLQHYLAIDRAHTIMLAEQEVIGEADARALLEAISKVDTEKVRNARFDGTVEDLFFYLQREIAGHCEDPHIAGMLHTARSRNDIDVTLYRLCLRELTLSLLESCVSLQDVFLGLAAQHHESLMPAYTHTQPAQPTTIAHYLLAMAENTGRDIRRLQHAYDNLNFCPLGACAITTTGFPIDRHRVADLLAFAAPTGNSYGSIASIDYFTELLGASAALLVNVGRFAQEFLLMAMMEFDVIRLPDGYVQSSSIMPQKRNPVALEHVRAIASKALGQTMGVTTSVHNTPFGDINDVEDDLQPLIYSALRDTDRAVALLSSTLRSAEFNTGVLQERAGDNFITATELADTLVRKEGIPFRDAHCIVATCVTRALEADGRISHQMLQSAVAEAGKQLAMSEDETRAALSAHNFVNVRTIHGGPAPEETRRALAELEHIADDTRAWVFKTVASLERSAKLLEEAVDSRLA